MGTSDSDAKRFIQGLEGLLRAAREAAAATLLHQLGDGSSSDGSGAFAGEAAAEDRWADWRLHRCTSDDRPDGLRVTVQLLAPRAIYEGAAVAMDWAEPPARVGARAALAAMAEWADHAPGGWRFGLGEVVTLPTAQGEAVVATVAVQRGDGSRRVEGDRWFIGCAWTEDDGPAAGARAVLNACKTLPSS